MILIIFVIFLGLTSTPTFAKDERLNHVKINDGEEVPPGRAPFMVHLRGEVMCGGSLLNERWIITSGDCVRNVKAAEKLEILVGTNYLSTGGQNYAVEKIIPHEDYDRLRDTNNNLALVKTAKPIVLSDKVKPVKLPETSEAGGDLMVFGWGRDRFALATGDSLLMKNVTSLSQAECQKYHDDKEIARKKIFDSQICTRPNHDPKVNCVINMGDNGGPLVNGDKLVGVIFYYYCCVCLNLPDIATRVYPYISWINETISNNS